MDDIAILSLGTTSGWRRADAALAEDLRALGYRCRVIPVAVGRAGRLRRSMLLTDVVEALAARHAASRLDARAVIICSITAALLQRRPRVPHAVRFDSLAALSRPGSGGAWQRRREPDVLRRAELLLPWGAVAAKSAERVLGLDTGGPAIVPLPVPITPEPDIVSARAAAREPGPTAVAYGANPEKRGLDVLLPAWERAAPPEAELRIGGIDRRTAERWLDRRGVAIPPGVSFIGMIDHAAWGRLVASAGLYVSAARYEDWGIAQLEALAAGRPLVTLPSPGPNEALPLARRLAPELVGADLGVPELTRAITAGLELSAEARTAYRSEARLLLAPYGPEAVRRSVADRVLPALLPSSA